MSIITRINKAEKRIVDLYNKLKNLPSGGGGVQTISGDFVDNTDPLNPILNDPRPYKVYTALLTQSGTDAPVATVLENTLGGDIVWSRNSVGIYTATLLGAFIDNKTTIQIIANRGKGHTTTSGVNDVDSVFLHMVNAVNLLADDILENTPIEIRVYS